MVVPWVAIWEHHNLAYFLCTVVVVDVLGSAVAEIPRGFVISLSFCFCCCDERESFELNLCQIGIEKQSRCFE